MLLHTEISFQLILFAKQEIQCNYHRHQMQFFGIFLLTNPMMEAVDHLKGKYSDRCFYLKEKRSIRMINIVILVS